MNVDFITAIKMFFANYANFKGRSTRAEYWWAMLFLFLVSAAINVSQIPLISGVFQLAVIIPTFAILVRRFHDTGRSGYLTMALYLISFVGAVVAIYPLVGAMINMPVPTQPDPEIIKNALLDNKLSFFGGLAVSVVAGFISLVITILPSAPDNKYGPNPYGE